MIVFLTSSITYLPNFTKVLISSAESTEDYDLFIQPNLAKINTIREVLMTPYVVGHDNYGYKSGTGAGAGLTCGANVEYSINTPFPNVANGYVNGCVLIDNDLRRGILFRLL